MPHSQRKAWVDGLIRTLNSLEGRVISAAIGTEMAIIEADQHGQPVFEVAGVPCLQLGVLYLQFIDGPLLKVVTHQDDDQWGLWPVGLDDRPPDFEADGIFRTRHLDEVPQGRIDAVELVFSPRGLIRSACLQVGEYKVILVAGEIYEHGGGELRFVNDDESILLFSDTKSLAEVEWG